MVLFVIIAVITKKNDVFGSCCRILRQDSPDQGAVHGVVFLSFSKLYPLLNFKNQNRSSLMFKTESLDWQQTCCNSSIRVRLGWTTAHSVFFQTSVFLWILCAQKCLPGSVQTWRFGRLLEWFGRILFGFQSHSRIRQAPCPMSHVNHVTILYHLEISEAKGVYGIKI